MDDHSKLRPLTDGDSTYPLVASSKTRSLLFLRRARQRQSFCFSPNDKWSGSIFVSSGLSPWSNLLHSSTSCKVSMISWSALKPLGSRFDLNVARRRKGSCVTAAIASRNRSCSTWAMSWPPIVIEPADDSSSLNNDRHRLVLPLDESQHDNCQSNGSDLPSAPAADGHLLAWSNRQ